MKQINEGLDYHDMKGQIEPLLTVDEYAAKMGKDSEIVTLAFIVKSKLAGEDLTSWLEKGYDYILDAQVSDGELTPGKYLVFAELKRRTSVPEKVIDILEDLQTLTDMPLEDWTIKIKDKTYKAEESAIKSNVTLSPHEYRLKDEKQEELNEFRELADLPSKNVFEENPYTKYIKSLAGM